MITPELLLEAVADVARVAGEVALRHFKTGIDVDTKGDGSPVTVADRTAEHIAREWIAARFPGDAVLGEEYGLTGDVRQRRWLIDPIDGTKTFVRGVPLWGTMIAVAEDDLGLRLTAKHRIGPRVAGRRMTDHGEAGLARLERLGLGMDAGGGAPPPLAMHEGSMGRIHQSDDRVIDVSVEDHPVDQLGGAAHHARE